MLGTVALKSSSLLFCKKYSSKNIIGGKKKKDCTLKGRRRKDFVQHEFQDDSHPVPPSST